MCRSQVQATLGQVTEDCSLVTRVHGVTGSRSHLGAHCPATPTKLDGKAPSCPFFFPQPPAVLNLGSGEDAGASSPAPKGLLAILNLIHPDSFQMTPLLPLPPPFHFCAPHQFHHPQPHGCVSSFRDSHRLPSNPSHPSPHPLTSFITSTISPACNCSSSACSGVVEVCLAPFSGPRNLTEQPGVGRVKQLESHAPIRGAGGGAGRARTLPESRPHPRAEHCTW